MKHCTVCGAAAREGAKFCTTCGARLEDIIAPDTTAATDQTATYPPVSDEPTVATDLPEEPETPSDWTSTGSGEVSETATTTYVPASEEPEPAAPTPAPDDDYASSWPSPEGTNEDTLPTYEDNEDTVPAYEDEQNDAGPTAASTGTPAWLSTADASEEPPANAGIVDEDTVSRDDADHHGASGWESWAPTPSPEPAVASQDHSLDDIREMVDTLKHRIDRLATPASLSSRDFDPDSLADDLEMWSGETLDTDELLAAIQAVRAAPRDLDAVRHLADHAAGLETLVDRYQSITSSSGTWAARLRRQRSHDTTA